MLKCWGVFRDTSRHLVAIWGNLEQGQVYSKKWKWLHYEGIIAGYWLDGWNNFTSWDEPLKNHNCSKNLTNRGSWKLWKGATPDTRCVAWRIRFTTYAPVYFTVASPMPPSLHHCHRWQYLSFFSCRLSQSVLIRQTDVKVGCESSLFWTQTF